MIDYGNEKLNQIFRDTWPNLGWAARKTMTHEEMLEEAEKREKENKALEALDKLYDENSDALQQLSVIERQELINEALEELNAIVLGGQNTREFYLSVSHIRNVLERLK